MERARSTPAAAEDGAARAAVEGAEGAPPGPLDPGGRADDSVDVRSLVPSDVSFPLVADTMPYVGRYQLNLAEWGLVKGDRLRCRLVCTDFRGSSRGHTVRSKPLYILISDRAGVLAAILEADRMTARDLDEMIEREASLGEAK